MRVSRLVFVCSGNICRSPYAEAKTRALGFETSSFGLNADDYSPCDPTAIKIARQHGVDLREHRSSHVDTFSARDGDLLIGMEPWHAKKLQSIANKSGAQVTLLGLWSDELRLHIEDPYGLSDDYFHTCFSLIDSAIENILCEVDMAARSRRNHKNRPFNRVISTD